MRVENDMSQMWRHWCLQGGGAAWKGAGVFANAPAWVQTVMRNNFKTPAGALAVSGLMGTPLWLWCVHYGITLHSRLLHPSHRLKHLQDPA